MTKQERRDYIASLINANTLNAKVVVYAMREELSDYIQQFIDKAGLHDKLKLKYSLCDTEVDQQIESDFTISDVANCFTLDVIASKTEDNAITISLCITEKTNGTLKTSIEINSEAFVLEKKDDADISALKLMMALNDSFDSLEAFVNSDMFISSLGDLTHQCKLYDDLTALDAEIQEETAADILNGIKPGDVIESIQLLSDLYVTHVTPKRVYVKSERGNCWFYRKQELANNIVDRKWKLIHK